MLTKNCLSEVKLNEYHNGWFSVEQQATIEAHLAECEACEVKLHEIDRHHATYFSGLANRISLRSGLTLAETKSTVNRLDDDSLVNQTLRQIQNWKQTPESKQTQWSDIKQLGQYEIVRPIGHGGMAQVFLATHNKLKRQFAVKILNVARSQLHESLVRLEREIEIVGQLQHPSIVTATDAGEQDGYPFLVTEFIEGLDLNQLARRIQKNHHAISAADSCELIRQTCVGLAYAHAQGVIHRDIKPSNLMLDKTGQIKILDFGLAQLQGWQDHSLELTSVGQLLGTLDYMAPEQAENVEAIDHRSDVFALGATLFRLLAGRAPYAATVSQSPLEKLRLLATTQPPKLKTLQPEIPDALCEIVDSCLHRDPNQRPASAAHLAEQLQPFTGEAQLIALIETAQRLPEVTNAPTKSLLFSKIQSKSAVPPNANKTPPRWPYWLVSAAGFFGFIFCAILLILETQKGQLVIQSEQANVKVRVLKDGKTYEEIEVHPGTNSTKLFAGNYEIEIVGASDGYEIDKQAVVLTKQNTVVARIFEQKVPAENPLEPITAEVNSKNTDLAATSTRQKDGPAFTAVQMFTPDDPAICEKILESMFQDYGLSSIVQGKQLICNASPPVLSEVSKVLKYIDSPSEIPYTFPPDHQLLVLSIESTGIETETFHQIFELIEGNQRFRVSTNGTYQFVYGPTQLVDKFRKILSQIKKACAENQPSKDIPTEPVWNGKTFSELETMFRFEQDLNGRRAALHGMFQFEDDASIKKATQIYIDELLSEHPPSRTLYDERAGDRSFFANPKLGFSQEQQEQVTGYLLGLPYEQATEVLQLLVENGEKKPSVPFSRSLITLCQTVCQHWFMQDKEIPGGIVKSVWKLGRTSGTDQLGSVMEAFLEQSFIDDLFIRKNLKLCIGIKPLNSRALQTLLDCLPKNLTEITEQQVDCLNNLRACINDFDLESRTSIVARLDHLLSDLNESDFQNQADLGIAYNWNPIQDQVLSLLANGGRLVGNVNLMSVKGFTVKLPTMGNAFVSEIDFRAIATPPAIVLLDIIQHSKINVSNAPLPGVEHLKELCDSPSREFWSNRRKDPATRVEPITVKIINGRFKDNENPKTAVDPLVLVVHRYATLILKHRPNQESE